LLPKEVEPIFSPEYKYFSAEKSVMKTLIVEDNDLLRDAMQRALRQWGAEVHAVATEEEALEALKDSPDLLIADVRLKNKGSGVRVVEAAAQLRPSPLMVAISGKASPIETFALAQAGVAAYVAKPLDFDSFVATIEAVIANPPDFGRHVAPHVGRSSYHDILRRVRRTMLEQALARSSGNRVHAARMLKVSRQAVQQLIKDFELPVESTTHHQKEQ
jgi:two-component system, response regulator RegA